MNWYYAESDTQPSTTDETSSKNWVYIRRNIQQKQRVDEESQLSTIYYGYEELKLLKSNYPIYQLEAQNAADLDYIAMMADIDLGR